MRLIDANAKELNQRINIQFGAVTRFIIKKLLKDAPTIDAVPVVHGRWIHPKGYVVLNGFLCSECGHSESSHHPINPRPGGCCLGDEHGNFFYPPKINYCPNCGAKMDLEVDGDEP